MTVAPDGHTRHIREFQTTESPAAPPSPTYGTDDRTCNSSGPYRITVTGDSSWNPNRDAEEKRRRIQENKEWERRLWKAKQRGRNVPAFPRR